MKIAKICYVFQAKWQFFEVLLKFLSSTIHVTIVYIKIDLKSMIFIHFVTIFTSRAGLVVLKVLLVLLVKTFIFLGDF